MGIGIEQLTFNQPDIISRLPLVKRPRILDELQGVDLEQHTAGLTIIESMGLDPAIGRLVVADNTTTNPGSRCTGGTIAEALATGHGGIQENLKGIIEDAKAEGVDPSEAVISGLRGVLKKVRESENAPEQLIEVSANVESLKKNRPRTTAQTD